MQNISVIIPVFNSEKTLKACLDSVLNQLGAEDELIISDDGSTDKSLSIAESFSKIKLLKSHLNEGAASARNKGAEKAIHPILVFLDSDIVLRNEELKTVKDYFENNPSVDALTGTLDSEKSSYNFFTDYKNLYMDYIFNKCGTEVNFIYGSFCAVRKNSFIPWPLSPRLGEDSHWGYLLSQKNKVIHLLKEISVIHLKHYDFYSLMQNDFKIASNFAILFLQYKRWKTIYSSEKFGHTTKNQKASLIGAFAVMLTFLVNIKLSALIFIIWFILSTDFFGFLYKKRGFTFFLKSVVWTFFDHLVYTAGIFKGTVSR